MKSQFHHFKLAIHHSIGARLLFYVLGTALISLVGMSYLFYKILQERAEQAIITNLEVQVKYIEVQLARVEEAMSSLASSISVMHESSAKHNLEDYKQLAFNFYLHRPSLVVGTGFGQTPYKIDSDRQGFWHYFYTDPKDPAAVGDVLPPPHDSIRYADLFITDQYFIQSYYTLPVSQRKATWTDSYKWYAITMVSFLSPIFSKNNDLLGVAGADIDVTELTRQIKTPLNWEQGYHVLLTEKGDLLSYPPQPEKAINIENYQQIPDISAIWDILQTHQKGFTHYNGNFWAYQRVANTKWLMLVSIPESQIILSAVKITLIGVFVAGGILMFVVISFVQWLNKRLQPILDECNRLIENNLSVNPININQPQVSMNKNMDEIEVLSHSFYHMTKQLEAYFSLLEEKVRERTHELNEKNDMLLKLNQEKNEFLGIVAHDLKNPLSGILGLSQAIKENIDTFSKDELIEFNRDIEQSAEKMFQLITNLLDVNAIESGKFNCILNYVDLVPILTSLCHTYEKPARDKKITIIFEKPIEKYSAWADENMVDQILDNVLSNAIKYSPFEKDVFIKIYRDESMIYCDIQDQGQGLSQADQLKLFKKFTRLTPKPTAKEHSTGLGLFIAKKLIESINGKISCKSELDHGSTFTVAFPTQPLMNENE
jgi:signal transduction histidine kinase